MLCPHTEHQDHSETGGEMIAHSLAGRGRYKAFPDLLLCPVCWTKVAKGKDGKWRIVRKNGNMNKDPIPNQS